MLGLTSGIWEEAVAVGEGKGSAEDMCDESLPVADIEDR